ALARVLHPLADGVVAVAPPTRMMVERSPYLDDRGVPDGLDLAFLRRVEHPEERLRLDRERALPVVAATHQAASLSASSTRRRTVAPSTVLRRTGSPKR